MFILITYALFNCVLQYRLMRAHPEHPSMVKTLFFTSGSLDGFLKMLPKCHVILNEMKNVDDANEIGSTTLPVACSKQVCKLCIFHLHLKCVKC